MFVIKYIKKPEATTHPRPVLAPDFCIAQTSIMAHKSIVGNAKINQNISAKFPPPEKIIPTINGVNATNPRILNVNKTPVEEVVVFEVLHIVKHNNKADVR